jgi:hypothetical protein
MEGANSDWYEPFFKCPCDRYGFRNLTLFIPLAKGAVKEAVGKVTGSKKLQAEGKADKAKGTIQNVAGDVKTGHAARPNSPTSSSHQAAHFGWPIFVS